MPSRVVRHLAIILTALATLAVLTGCATRGADLAPVIDALAKDPATACARVSAFAPGWQTELTLYRTANPDAVVRCSKDGMDVTSGPR